MPRKLYLMKAIGDPTCTLCPMKVIGSYFHMFWECAPVTRFWRMVVSNLSKMFKVKLPCWLAALILNDLSYLGLSLIKN